MDIPLSSPGTTAPWRSVQNVPLYVGMVGALVAALGAAVALTAGTGARYALACVACYALTAGAVVAGHRRHQPRPPFGLASRVTLFRAVLISLVAGLVALPAVELTPAWAWVVTGVAAAAFGLDALDGWVARRLGHATAFGARFDQELDAFFILVLSVLVWRLDQVGAWVVLIGAMRYLFWLAGRLWPRLGRPLPPRRRRKVVCGLQVGALFAALAPPVGPEPAGALAAVALAGLLYSFSADVLWLLRTGDDEGPAARATAVTRHARR